MEENRMPKLNFRNLDRKRPPLRTRENVQPIPIREIEAEFETKHDFFGMETKEFPVEELFPDIVIKEGTSR